MPDSQPAIRFVTVVTTADCNLRCRYCYLARKRPGGARWPAVRAALETAVHSAPLRLQVGFTGGEPLLQFPLVRRCVQHVEQVCRPACPVRYVITTNGLRLGATEAEFLDHYGFQVNLSFDGVPAAQAQRGRTTFDRLDCLLDTLRRRWWNLFNERLRIVITLTPATIPYLSDCVDYFVGKDVRAISVSVAMRQRGWRRANIRQLDAQFRRVFDSMLRVYEDTGAVPLVQFRKTAQTLAAVVEPDTWICRAPTGQTIAIDVDGTAYGCLLATASYQDDSPPPSLRRASAALRLGPADGAHLGQRLAAIGPAAAACGVFQNPGLRYSCYRRCHDCDYIGRCHVCPFSTTPGRNGSGRWRVDDFVCAFNQVALRYTDLFPRQPDDVEIVTGRAPVPRHLRKVLHVGASAFRF